MNPAADPIFVNAEVAYRFERDRVITDPAADHGRTGRLHAVLARLVRPARRHHRRATRARHA